MKTRAAKPQQPNLDDAASIKSAPAVSSLHAAPRANEEPSLISSYSPATAIAPSGCRRIKMPRLMQLPAEQQQEVRDWLIKEGLTYEATAKRVFERFGVSISRTGVFNFYKEFCEPLLERAQAATSTPPQQDAPPLVDISITAAAVHLRIQMMPDGAVFTTKGDAS